MIEEINLIGTLSHGTKRTAQNNKHNEQSVRIKILQDDKEKALQAYCYCNRF
jgi:hypothetical protein